MFSKKNLSLLLPLIFLNLQLFANEQGIELINSREVQINDKIHHIELFKRNFDNLLNLKYENQNIAQILFKESDPKIFLINKIYVEPEFRNKGYGKCTFKYVLEYLINIGAKEIKAIPVPFEMVNGSMKFCSDDDFDKYSKLFEFYKSLGFSYNSIYMILKVNKSDNKIND